MCLQHESIQYKETGIHQPEQNGATERGSFFLNDPERTNENSSETSLREKSNLRTSEKGFSYFKSLKPEIYTSLSIFPARPSLVFYTLA